MQGQARPAGIQFTSFSPYNGSKASMLFANSRNARLAKLLFYPAQRLQEKILCMRCQGKKFPFNIVIDILLSPKELAQLEKKSCS